MTKVNMYSRNVIDVDWGLVVKLALPAKVTILCPLIDCLT
jgi:hypothetical protein